MTHLKIEVVASRKKAKSLDFNLIYVFTEFSAFKHLNHESFFFFLHGVIDNFEQFKFSIFFALNSSIIEMISVLLLRNLKKKLSYQKVLKIRVIRLSRTIVGQRKSI